MGKAMSVMLYVLRAGKDLRRRKTKEGELRKYGTVTARI